MGATYEVKFEIAGPAAMFTRPDTGSAFISYPVPTYSAAKGMFEAVARIKTAHINVYIRPTKVEVCCPIRYERYVTNCYGGQGRKGIQIKKGNSYQIMAIILVDVCYRIYGIVEWEWVDSQDVDSQGRSLKHLHFLEDKFKTRLCNKFKTRLRNGHFYYMPCLGWKEFVPSYMGPFRPETKVRTDYNEIIPSMLYTVFDKPVDGTKKEPVFRHNVEIKNGVLEYA